VGAPPRPEWRSKSRWRRWVQPGEGRVGEPTGRIVAPAETGSRHATSGSSAGLALQPCGSSTATRLGRRGLHNLDLVQGKKKSFPVCGAEGGLRRWKSRRTGKLVLRYLSRPFGPIREKSRANANRARLMPYPLSLTPSPESRAPVLTPPGAGRSTASPCCQTREHGLAAMPKWHSTKSKSLRRIRQPTDALPTFPFPE